MEEGIGTRRGQRGLSAQVVEKYSRFQKEVTGLVCGLNVFLEETEKQLEGIEGGEGIKKGLDNLRGLVEDKVQSWTREGMMSKEEIRRGMEKEKKEEREEIRGNEETGQQQGGEMNGGFFYIFF